MSDEHVSVTKVPNFTGRKFRVFDSQFKAVCTLKKCDEALEETFKKELPARSDAVLDDTNATEKKQKEALMKNNLAMSYLAFALTTEEGLDFLEESKSAEFPGGEAHRVYTALKDEYVPNDQMSKAQQLNELSVLKLKKNEDPKKLGKRVIRVVNSYRNKIDEEQLVAVVVRAAGKTYANCIRQESRYIQRIESRHATAKELISAMAEQWRISGGRNDDEANDTDDDAEPTDVALVDSSAGSKVKCFKCSERGHFARDCPKSRTGDIKCTICGKGGHVAASCWDNPENPNVPKWIKDKRGGGSEATGACVEVLIPSLVMEESVESVDEKGVEFFLGSVTVDEVSATVGKSRVTVDERGVTVDTSRATVGESKSGAKVGESKGAVWMGSEAKVGVDVTGVACKSCAKMGVGVQKSENGRVDGSIESADWGSKDITSKNDQWVGKNGAAEHWCVGSANSERGRVLEVAQNVATLDGFVSLGKSNVTKKEF